DKMIIDSNIPVTECAKIMKSSAEFIRHSIKNRSFPGSYVENDTRFSFYVPRKAFYKYMGWDNRDIELYEKNR
ncbi:MAG: hypothetical protein ACK5LF_25395, partial [Bacteroides xylanisolvens]